MTKQNHLAVVESPEKSGADAAADPAAPWNAPKPAWWRPNFNPNRPGTPTTVEQALQMQAGAETERAIGQAMIEEDGDRIEGRFHLAQARDMDAAVAAFMEVEAHGPVQAGNGGELVVASKEALATIPGVIDTIKESPDMVAAAASRKRLELAGNSLTLAIDAADTIQPKNSLERMLAHQLAQSHRLAMLFGNKAAAIVDQHGDGLSQFQSVEASRLAGTAVKLMGSFQEGCLALDKIRRGGKQTVKVVHQHVAVGPGGQAVVAGNMKAGVRKSRGRAEK
jgi:hypothetical protein